MNAIRAITLIPNQRTRFNNHNNQLRVSIVFADYKGITVRRLTVYLMKRGTIMVLKRFVLVALGPLGLSALLVGPASADVPPPNLLKDVAACIAAHAPARPARH